MRVAQDVWFSLAGTIAEAFGRRLGTTPWVLRALEFARVAETDGTDATVELELRDADWTPPRNGRWVGLGELDRLPLRHEDERTLLAGHLAGLELEPPARSPWARPGWLAEVAGWIEEAAAASGRTVRAIEQVKHWSLSSVLRVVTDAEPLWFKAGADLPLFAEEGPVTAALARRFPEHVLAPLAVDRTRNWLLLPAFDETFGWDAPLALRCEALGRFADLQRRSASVRKDLLADGCLDRGLDVLISQLPGLVADPDATARLEPDEAAGLRRRLPDLLDACRRLAALGLPETLVHGDLYILNVARVEGRLVYFDWTDACVAHPFIDLLQLQWERDEAARAALLDAYLAPWQGAASPETLAEAVELATIVTPLHHAVSYAHIVAGLEPAARAEIDLTAGFLRAALRRVESLPAD